MKDGGEPNYKMPPLRYTVPGTDFTVDWHCKTHPRYVHSFLSHCHSDHLSGIESFRSPRVLHCTPITAQFLLLKYPKLSGCIETHEVGSVFYIDAITITVFDANHTPGSAMFLFESPLGRKTLHTGDFRANEKVCKSIEKFSPVNQLFIDSTYATSKLIFISREVCIKWVQNKVTENLAKNILTLIGTYTIGKEELVIAVSNHINQPVFAPVDRYQSVRHLMDTNYCKKSNFTDDATKSKVFLVPIGDCNDKNAAHWAHQYGYNSVCAIAATGWSGKKGWETPRVNFVDGVSVTLFSVPYSDHSSPNELLEFVKVARPKKIISTTSRSQNEEEKIQKMFLPFIRKEKNKNFIEFYAKK